MDGIQMSLHISRHSAGAADYRLHWVTLPPAHANLESFQAPIDLEPFGDSCHDNSSKLSPMKK